MVRYDPTRFVAESISEVMRTLVRGDAAGLPGRLRLPPGLARHADPRRHDPRLADRHLRGAQRDRLRRSTPSRSSRWCSRSAWWWTTRSWWWRTSRACSAEGMPRREAVLRSMGEVTSAIVAATLVLGAVFVPVALLPGTTGLMLRHFGLAVTCAVLISLLNALTLSPALCALLMRPRARAQARLLPRLRPRLRAAWSRATTAACARCCRGAALVLGDLRGALRGQPRCCSAPCRPASSPTRTRATSSPASSSRTAPRSSAPTRWRARSSAS